MTWARFARLGLAVLLALAVLNTGRRAIPPIDRDEPRYAQATEQMLASGDWVDVRFQDQPRWLQPAGIYWLQALAVRAFGQPGARAIGTNRLVSLAGATVALALTGEIGALAFGSGLAAMGLLAATVLLGFEARLATIDATLLAAVLAAQFSLMRVYLGRAGWRTAIAFWAALGVGIMLKGPVILLVSFGTIAALALVERRIGWWRTLRPRWGVAVMVAIATPWLIAIGVKSGGGFFVKSVGDNFLGKVATGQQAHFGLPGFHLALLPVLAGAAFPFIVRATPWSLAGRRDPVVRFLLCWLAPTWIVFELIATKLPHYVLPAYPAITVLAAGGLGAAMPDAWRRLAYRPLCAIWAVAMAALAVGPLAAVLVAGEALSTAEVAWRAAVTAAGLGLVAATLRLMPGRGAVACACCAFAAISTVGYGSLPRLEAIWIAPRVAALVERAKPCPDTVVASASFSEPSLVYLLGTPTRLTPAEDAANFVADAPECRLALVGDRDVGRFMAALAQRQATPRDLGHVAGITLSTGRRVDLGLYAATPEARDR